ncbi:MAG: hypothetical protein ACFFBU_01165 [Promethearchaeota archaeon]
MKLNTIRAVLQFAFDLEAMASAFYETAITITTTQGLKSQFEAYLIRGQSHIQLLMQIRHQLTPSLLAEGVSMIESEQYRPHTECPPGCPDEQLIELASKMEKQIHEYYLVATNQLGFIEKVGDIFDQLAEEHMLTQKKLLTRP